MGQKSKKKTAANSSGKKKDSEDSKVVLGLDAVIDDASKVPATAEATGDDGRKGNVAAVTKISGIQVDISGIVAGDSSGLPLKLPTSNSSNEQVGDASTTIETALSRQ